MLAVICFTQLKYKEDYNKNVKGQWCETPYFDVATARVAMENLSNVRTWRFLWVMWLWSFYCLTVALFSFQRRYTQHYEGIKDQIYFMQTDTPVYDTNKKARIAASEVSVHKHTETKVWEYFYRAYLMWKTRQSADLCLRAERESTHWRSTWFTV